MLFDDMPKLSKLEQEEIKRKFGEDVQVYVLSFTPNWTRVQIDGKQYKISVDWMDEVTIREA